MRPIVVIRSIVILCAVVGIIIAGKFLYEKSSPKTTLPYYATVPDFDFITKDSVSFSQKELQGKISVVDFMFTRCKGPCPIMSNLMGELYRHFEGVEDVQFVSISVDPQYDTLLALREYAKVQGVTDKRWEFLSAPMKEVVKLCEGGFKLAADDLPGAHSVKFVLVDTEGKIRGYYSGIEKESVYQLQKDIESIL